MQGLLTKPTIRTMKAQNLNVRQTLLALGMGLGLAVCLLDGRTTATSMTSQHDDRPSTLAHHVALLASPWRAHKTESTLLP